jgi:tRNA threonylcarbamoyladenosine biosynthesis protein TsaB
MIIAIESASADPSLALVTRDGALLASDGWSADRRQGADLMPRLLALLEAQGRDLRQATGLAVGIGPGSFTGLRVGLSIGKGLAYALGLPLVGIGSLAAWLAAEPEAPAALARAGAREAWLLTRGAEVPIVVDRDALSPQPLVGGIVPTELAAAFGLEGTIAPYRGAVGVASLAVPRLATASDDLVTLEPAYLRAPRGLESGAPPAPR